MSTNIETGHAKNVANLEELISIISAQGTSYNPVKASIKLTALQTLSTSSKSAVTAYNTAEATLKFAIANRQNAFEPLRRLMCRVYYSLESTDSSYEIDGTVKSLYRKIQGRRKTPYKTEAELKAAEAAGEKIVEHSSSQMGYDTRLDNIEKFIKLLFLIPQYVPNEADIKVTALTTLLTDLRAKNAAVVAARTQLAFARQNRNTVLYKDLTGMVDIVYDVKMYVRSLYGMRSPQYQMVSSLQFKKQIA